MAIGQQDIVFFQSICVEQVCRACCSYYCSLLKNDLWKQFSCVCKQHFKKNLCLFNKKNWTFPQKYVNNVYMIPN